MTRPFNNAAVASIQASIENASQELKSSAIGNTNSGSDTVMGSAESGLVKDSEESEPTEKSKEEVQGGDQPLPISSWYSFWGWHSSANASGSVQLESEGLEVKNVSEDMQVDVPLLRSRPEPISETHEGDTPSASVHLSPQPINPITSSMEANWGGWASFFNSSSSMVKTLGHGVRRRAQDFKRNGNGMEVMDIDDERRNVGEKHFFWARGPR